MARSRRLNLFRTIDFLKTDDGTITANLLNSKPKKQIFKQKLSDWKIFLEVFFISLKSLFFSLREKGNIKLNADFLPSFSNPFF